jgi:glutaredoxin-related protein
MVFNLKQKIERKNQKDVVFSLQGSSQFPQCKFSHMFCNLLCKERRKRHKQDVQRGVESNARNSGNILKATIATKLTGITF